MCQKSQPTYVVVDANSLFVFLCGGVFLQVYASNNQKTVMVSSICGPCDVLHVDKFREETNRRNQVVSSDSELHPIFFGRFVSNLLIYYLVLV